MSKDSKCIDFIERNSESEVFQNMDTFELSEASKFDMSIRLQFPKFSKGFSVNDFESFIKSNIGEENLVAIGRLAFPNEWQMQVKSKEVREKLIRLGRTKINTRTCWISPLSQNEVRGYVHWLPNAISDKAICDVLNPYGKVLFMEFQNVAKWARVNSDSRYFAMHLTPGKTMDDLPHMVKLEGHLCLITIRGRRPCCFHCRDVGHRKSECKKYREKLQGFCMRKPTDKKRTKPRGKRYKPNLKLTDEQNAGKSTDEVKPSQTKETVKKQGKLSDSKATTKPNKGKPSVTSTATDTNTDKSDLGVSCSLDVLKSLATSLTTAVDSWNTEIEAVKKKLAGVHISSAEEKDTQTCDSEQTSALKKKSKKKKKKHGKKPSLGDS